MTGFDFNEMLQFKTVGAIVSAAILGFVALFIISGIIFGIKRGFSKSVVRLLTVVLAAGGAYFICSFAFVWISSFVEGKSLEEVLRIVISNYDSLLNEKYRNVIASIDSSTAYDLAKLLVALFIPFIFVFVFLILKAIVYLIYLILGAIVTGHKKGFFSRLFGMIVGALQGAFIAAVILVPLAGYANVALEFKATFDTSVEATAEELTEGETPEGETPEGEVSEGETPEGQIPEGETPDSEAPEGETANQSLVDTVYGSFLDDVIVNPVLSVINKYGGFVFEKLLTVKTDAGEVDMSDEAVHIADITFNCLELKGANFKELSPEDHGKLDKIADKINGDPYLCSIISGVLRSVANGVDSGAIVIPAPDPFGSLVGDSISVFESSDKNNLAADLDTILNVYYILSDHKIIVSMNGGNSDEVLNALVKTDEQGSTAVSLIIDEFEKNPRMTFMISNITKLSVSIMSGSLGMDEEAEQVYVELKDDIKGALELNASDYETEEEYKEAVGTKVDEALQNQGITLKAEEIEVITDHIAENYSDVSDISDADIDSALLSYYDAYLKSLESGETPELPEDFPELPEGFPEII